MNRVITTAALTCLLITPSYAQKATAVGTGVGVAKSTSVSGAVAISGQGGAGGTGGSSSSSLTINNPANTSSTVDQRISGTTTQNTNLSGTTTSNVNQNVSGSTSQNINSNGTTRVISSGTTTVRSAPPIAAPSLSAAGLETCLGSASGGISAVGFGISGGSSTVDEGCQARLDSRTLASYGLKAAAVARLCQRADIWRSMPDVCTQYWPAGQPVPYGIVVAAPLVAPSGTYMSASIRVVDGRDGVEKDCLNYNATRQKCNHWAGEAPRRIRSAALTPAKSQVKPQSKPKPAPAVEAIETAAPTPSNQ